VEEGAAMAVLARVTLPLAPLRTHPLARPPMHQHAAMVEVNPIRCARAWTVSQAVAEIPTVAALATEAAQVAQAIVLEATQMATDKAGTVALIAGASGLVGKELLALLLKDSACREVHSLVRKPATQTHAKLHSHVVDFAKLGAAALPAIDEVYICLGTTIKVAGSQAAFKAVDFDAVVAVAGIGLAQGAKKLGVISAMGASSSSSVFYSKVKGEMEEAVSKLGYQSVSIARPSFLAGDRESLNQTARPGEKLALVAMSVFNPLIPKNYKAVQASDVAAALLRQVRLGAKGQTVLLSGQLRA
jgi:uncharacterized protein YbjT (DUF2867 family)